MFNVLKPFYYTPFIRWNLSNGQITPDHFPYYTKSSVVTMPYRYAERVCHQYTFHHSAFVLIAHQGSNTTHFKLCVHVNSRYKTNVKLPTVAQRGNRPPWSFQL